MTYDRFLKHIKNKDYIMIKLTNEYPFFVEKVFVKDGKTTIANNYHIADGMFSHYINSKCQIMGFQPRSQVQLGLRLVGNIVVRYMQ